MFETLSRRPNLLAAVCVVALALYALNDLRHASKERPFGARLEERDGEPQVVYLRDFPAHLRFARLAWSGYGDLVTLRGERLPSIYSPFGHQVVMARWLGRDHTSRALPFGYSPTMICILGPLTTLPDEAAFAVWVALGILAAWWMCRAEPAASVAVLFILISPVAGRSQALGQTAILTTAALVFLMREARKVEPNFWLMAAVLWALTAKPPLAVTAGVALIGLRLVRPVVIAVLMACATTLPQGGLLGAGWAGDYVHLLTHYTKATADPLFAWSLGPEYMSNLRSILSLYLKLPDDASSRIASLLWLVALPLIAWRGGWRTAILAMLLLGPHVNSTEDLALVAVAAAVPLSLPVAGLAVLAVWATPGYSPPVGLLWPLPAFALKVAVLAVVLLSARTPPQNHPPPP